MATKFVLGAIILQSEAGKWQFLKTLSLEYSKKKRNIEKAKCRHTLLR